MLNKAITLYRLRAVSDFLFHFVLWLTLMKRQSVTKTKYWHTSDFLPTVLIHLRHKLCLSEYSPSRPFWHFVCILSTMDTPEAQSVLVRSTHTHTHTHTLQPGEQCLSCGLCSQRLFIKHVPQFSNSKDGILQQSPIELILSLSLGFREERMCEGEETQL